MAALAVSRPCGLVRPIFVNRLNIHQHCARLSSTNTQSTDVFVDSRAVVSSKEEEPEEMNLRNVSRLPYKLSKQYLKLPSRMVKIDPEVVAGMDRRLQRKMYARFGTASGLDPSIMWPTAEEIRDSKRIEKEWEPTLQERIAKLQEKEAAEKEYMKKRLEKVEASMAKMPKQIEEFHQKEKKKEAEKKKQEEKRQKAIEEAREMFGYSIDPRDEKFKLLMEEKEKAEKKLAKQKKKQEKADKLMARLQLEADVAKSSSS